MKNTSLSLLLAGACASALLSIGMAGLAQRIDPVVSKARPVPAIELAWDQLPFPPVDDPDPDPEPQPGQKEQKAAVAVWQDVA